MVIERGESLIQYEFANPTFIGSATDTDELLLHLGEYLLGALKVSGCGLVGAVQCLKLKRSIAL